MRDRTRDVILRGMMKIHGYRAEKFSFLCFFHRCVRILLAQYRVFDMWHAQRVETVEPVLLSFFPAKGDVATRVLSLSPSLSLSLPLGYLISPNFFCPFNFGRRELTSVQKVFSATHAQTHTHMHTRWRPVSGCSRRDLIPRTIAADVFYADVIENLSSGCAKWSGTEWRRMRNV